MTRRPDARCTFNIRDIWRGDGRRDGSAGVGPLHHEVDGDERHNRDGDTLDGFASGSTFKVIRPLDSSGESEILLPPSTSVTPGGSGFPKTEPSCRNWTSKRHPTLEVQPADAFHVEDNLPTGLQRDRGRRHPDGGDGVAGDDLGRFSTGQTLRPPPPMYNSWSGWTRCSSSPASMQ
jgi:hypothetical protein